MKKKTSPKAGPTRRPRSRPAGATTKLTPSTARPGLKGKKRDRASRVAATNIAERTTAQRIRSYISIAIVPNGTAVLIAIILALLLLVVSSTTLAALPATVAQIWLVMNMVPAHGGGITVGLLPMVPAVLLGLAVARRVCRNVKETVSLRTLGGIVLACLGLAVLLSLTAEAMLLDASQVFEVAPTNVAVAIGMTLALHTIAVVFGMGPRLWRALAKHFGVSTLWVDATLSALKLGLRLLLVGLIAALISLAMHFQAVSESLQPYNTRGMLGVIVVCLLYLPNVAITATAMLLGADFHIQDLSLSLFDAQPLILPPVPWFAALPQDHAAWMPLLMAVPAVILFRHAIRSLSSWKQLACSTAVLGLSALFATSFAGGHLGFFGGVGPGIWLSAVLIMAWYAGIGAATLAVATYLTREPVVEPEVVEATEEAPASADEDKETTSDVIEGEIIEEESTAEAEAEEAPVDSEASDELATPEEPEEAEKLEKDTEEQ